MSAGRRLKHKRAEVAVDRERRRQREVATQVADALRYEYPFNLEDLRRAITSDVKPFFPELL